jgi:hypothetical protein
MADKSVPRIAALIWLGLKTVVDLAVPFQLIVQPDPKPEPETASVKPFEPAAAVEGEIDRIVGGSTTGVEPEPPQPPNHNRHANKTTTAAVGVRWHVGRRGTMGASPAALDRDKVTTFPKTVVGVTPMAWPRTKFYPRKRETN